MKKDIILCYLLEKDTKDGDTFISFISHNHIEIRNNHPQFGFNIDNLNTEEVFRLTITTQPGSIHTICEKPSVNDWIWLNNQTLLQKLKEEIDYLSTIGNYKQHQLKLQKLLNKIPQMAQQLRNSKIENILEKTNDDK